MLCKYETNWGKVSALFGLPTFHVPERYAENNLWGIGRGSFVRNYMKLKRGKKYGISPFERIYQKSSDGGRPEYREKQVGLDVTTDVVTTTITDSANSRATFRTCGRSQMMARR